MHDTMPGLRQAVRIEIASAYETHGMARPRDIARRVCATHDQEILKVGLQLAENALTVLARNELKQRTCAALSTQLDLFAVPQALRRRLPPAISLPDSTEAAQSDACVYKPLVQATLSEILMHLDMLSAQITADIRSFEALSELRDMALDAGIAPDQPVFDALRKLQTEAEGA